MKKTLTLLLGTAACVLMVQTSTAAATDTNSPAPAEAAAVQTPATNAPAPADVAAAQPPATNAAAPAAEAMAAADTQPATAAPQGIPQVRFSDVPLTTAIENLARLANINYMLDPKIGYGQPDASGQIKAEPTLSIHWENITAENALLALLDNYGLQVIHDKHTGIARITTKDPSAPPPLFTKVYQLKYTGVSNIIDAVSSVLTDKQRSKVMADSRTSQLVVVATDPEQVQVEALIDQLDKPTRQVLIETRLVEISSNPRTQKGVDWSGTLKNQKVNFGNNTGSSGGGTNSGLGGLLSSLTGSPGILANTKSGFTPNTFFLDADGVAATLSFLNSSADAQVMSTPRIVTLDNETANISVTRTYPIFNVTAGTANTTGGSSVNYSNVGTILQVTPRISANDYIWMRVIPTVSSFFGTFSQVVGGTVYQAPIFDTRYIQTDVMVPNSNTLVLGGLVQNNPESTYTKVPVLGDIPGLGRLFSSEDKQAQKDNLLIFITPTVVKDADFQASRSGDFLKSKPVTIKDPIDPKSIWDNASPDGSWSDPIPAIDK